MTDEGAALGRVLFYDRRLSATGTVSCGSCHIQERGFIDGRRFSRGFAGEATDRRSMPLANLRYYQRTRFFWDERAAGLAEMVLLPIEPPVEMGHTVDAVVEHLQADQFLPAAV